MQYKLNNEMYRLEKRCEKSLIYSVSHQRHAIKTAKRPSNDEYPSWNCRQTEKKNVDRASETYLTGVFFTGGVTGAEHVGGHRPIASINLSTVLLIHDRYNQVS